MAKVFQIGKVTGLEISVRSTVIPWFLGLWLVFGLAAYLLLRFPLEVSAAASLGATLLHYLYELWHNFGHAQAARRVGYPMRGVQFYGPLAVSQYPLREEKVSPRAHIQRALGGPLASLFLGLVAGAVAWLLWSSSESKDSLSFWIIALGAFENLFVFGLGAFMPLGWTDGSTLLHWLPRRKTQV